MVAIFEKKFITLRSWLLISLHFYFVIRIVKQEENWGHTACTLRAWAAITYLFSQKFQVLMLLNKGEKMHDDVSEFVSCNLESQLFTEFQLGIFSVK